MGRLHLKNIVFPAVLVSCTVFSSMTVPFILSDSNPITLNLPPLFQGEIQPFFGRESKGATIRYIGLAIVSSVGSGLLTIEILRRLQASDESPAQTASVKPQTAHEQLSSLDRRDGDPLENLENIGEPHPLERDIDDDSSRDAKPDWVWKDAQDASEGNSESAIVEVETSSSSVSVLQQGPVCLIGIAPPEQTV